MTKIIEHDPIIFKDEEPMIPIGDKCCADICRTLNDSIIDKDITAEHCGLINIWAREHIYPLTTSGMEICHREQKKSKILKDMRLTLKENNICKCIG
jgi:hypothetical protein